MNDEPGPSKATPPDDEIAEIQASLRRLTAAGLIRILDYDPATDRGIVELHPSLARLLSFGDASVIGQLILGDAAAEQQPSRPRTVSRQRRRRSSKG